MLGKLFNRVSNQQEKKEIILNSPIIGEAVLFSEVPDPMFAGEMLGKGIAIKPTEGILYAPCDGVITMVYDTKHAIGMTTQNDIEILLHVGVDTVELKGEFFEVLVENGDEVGKGKPLLKFDIDGIIEKGYPTITPMIITNTDDYDMITVIKQGNVDVDTEVLMIK